MAECEMATGVLDRAEAPTESQNVQLAVPHVTSEIVIVDDDGNEEPYDPSKL
jgi:hypothetical protein